MKLFSAHLKDVRALYMNSLHKALDMEEQISRALPTMIGKATDPELKAALEAHLSETCGHVSKVERLLQSTGNSNPLSCKIATALIHETQHMIKDADSSAIRDISLIAAAQQVEHHEIAVYGTLRKWAGILGEDSHACLDQILSEEKHADGLLSSISDRLNVHAEMHVMAGAH